MRNLKEIDGVKMRKCTVCKEWKPLDEFSFLSPRKGYPNGSYQSKCKPCNAARVAKYRRKNFDKVNRKKREWAQKNKTRINQNESKRRANFTQAYILRRRVRGRLYYAIKTGKIEPASSFICSHENCSKQASDWHHHNGYTEGHEYDVIPLCRMHHNMAHRKYDF